MQHLVLLPPTEWQTVRNPSQAWVTWPGRLLSYSLFICRWYREAVLTQNCVNQLVCYVGVTGPCVGLKNSLKYWEHFLYRQQKLMQPSLCAAVFLTSLARVYAHFSRHCNTHTHTRSDLLFCQALPPSFSLVFVVS